MNTVTRQPRISTLLVADAMHQGVFACEREAPLSEVAATMVQELVHCVVVDSGSGEAGPPWGIVSDLDLVAAALVRDLEDRAQVGRRVAGRHGPPDETLERAAQLMTEHSTTHLVVVDRERRARRRALDSRHRCEPHRGERRDEHADDSVRPRRLRRRPPSPAPRRREPPPASPPGGSLTLVTANDTWIAVHAGWTWRACWRSLRSRRRRGSSGPQEASHSTRSRRRWWGETRCRRSWPRSRDEKRRWPSSGATTSHSRPESPSARFPRISCTRRPAPS